MSGTRATLRNTGSLGGVTTSGVPLLLPGVYDGSDMSGGSSGDPPPGYPGAAPPGMAPGPPGQPAGAVAMGAGGSASPYNPKYVLTVGGYDSNHPGGFNGTLGDGSVRFFSQSIDMKAFSRLGHRADGQLIKDRW
jgi:hypothetical protein